MERDRGSGEGRDKDGVALGVAFLGTSIKSIIRTCGVELRWGHGVKRMRT
jgi:hypothetical protein